MLVISDRVKESSVSTGFNNLVLTGAHGGFQTFQEGIGDGNTTYYAIENNVRWEVGVGTYNATGNYLSRDTVLSSSSGGAKIELAGVSVVFCTMPASKAVLEDTYNNVHLSGIFADSGVISSLSGVSFYGPTIFTGDILASGNVDLDNGFLSLIRPNSDGGFFHAYKDDGTERTFSLHVNNQIDDPL